MGDFNCCNLPSFRVNTINFLFHIWTYNIQEKLYNLEIIYRYKETHMFFTGKDLGDEKRELYNCIKQYINDKETIDDYHMVLDELNNI